MMQFGRGLNKQLKVLGAGCFYLLVFTVIGLAVACSNKNKIPSDVMAQDKMEKVMWDMIQADRFSSQFLERDSVAKKNIKVENLKLYEQVFQHHKISKDEFLRSFQFYLSRPDLNKPIFDTMSARADRRRAEMYKSDTAKALK
ncbi:DUF4296 domain-containing protein [Paraflavitalea sp. CAU 1676]|uniref:DUF4296 domain-containing protein n=1 Tax=Paraflavitalea sp. CAU 1676 TaxID=3032598 RepID=UPI0023DC5A90|nr:DUF4296 domain-containing protein [Paraflavitalea sp. CAU 1676]MDF2189386.1 DUF4296 domain-containing protein [Paraflavitalea sp. CAU 1676]